MSPTATTSWGRAARERKSSSDWLTGQDALEALNARRKQIEWGQFGRSLMKLFIALLALLSAGTSFAATGEQGWDTSGQWLNIDSGNLIGTDSLHVPNP